LTITRFLDCAVLQFHLDGTCDGIEKEKSSQGCEAVAKTIIDPKWDHRSELRDLLKYHRYGGWIIPWMLVFPKLSRNLMENLGGMVMPGIASTISVFPKYVLKGLLKNLAE